LLIWKELKCCYIVISVKCCFTLSTKQSIIDMTFEIVMIKVKHFYTDNVFQKNYTFTPTMYLLVLSRTFVFSFAWQNIPSEFGKRHLLGLGKKQGDIHLRLSNGRVWPARYQIRKGNRKEDKFEMYSSGWKTFAEDNNLKVGDVCTFELFSTSTILTFIVHIFRDSFET